MTSNKWKKAGQILLLVSKILFWIGMLLGAIHLAACLFIPTAAMIDVNDIPQKDAAWIAISTAIIVGTAFVASFCADVLAFNCYRVICYKEYE